MNTAQLDALLTDRALGELSSEVTALLAEHLARDPHAARRAAEFDTTLALARAASTAPRERPAKLDVARLRREPSAGRATVLRLRFVSLAGALAAGLALGWFLRPAPVAAPSLSVPQPTPTHAAVRASDPATQFWSVARFAPEATRGRLLKNR